VLVAVAAIGILLSGCETQFPEPTLPLRPTGSPLPTTTAEPDPAAMQADLLFATPERCDLSIADHIISIPFPSYWSTNDAIEEGAPSCIWFGPNLTHPTTEPPADAAIGVGGVGGPAVFPYKWVSREETTVAGRPAWRVEEWVPSPSGPYEETLQLVYWVSLGDSRDDGPTLVARTATDDVGHYALNKAVLDRMMATLAIR
jgi:hypothetical protein